MKPNFIHSKIHDVIHKFTHELSFKFSRKSAMRLRTVSEMVMKVTHPVTKPPNFSLHVQYEAYSWAKNLSTFYPPM